MNGLDKDDVRTMRGPWGCTVMALQRLYQLLGQVEVRDIGGAWGHCKFSTALIGRRDPMAMLELVHSLGLSVGILVGDLCLSIAGLDLGLATLVGHLDLVLLPVRTLLDLELCGTMRV